RGFWPILWSAQWNIFESRRAVLETVAPSSLHNPSLAAHIFWAGAYRDALPLMERRADAVLERGELHLAAALVAYCAGLRAAIGDLASAERDLMRLAELVERAGNTPMVVCFRDRMWFEVFYCRGTGLELAGSPLSAADAAVAPAFWRAGAHSINAV